MLISNKTKAQISAYIDNPRMSLLLVGDRDSGIDTVINYILDNLLVKTKRSNISYITEDEKSVIGIDKIREIRHSMAHKYDADNDISRVFIIKNGEKMTEVAQNTLLKTLEEPNMGSLIFIATEKPQLLLPTIISRCVKIPILPISIDELSDEYSKSHPMELIVKNYFISEGKSQLFHDLINEKKDNGTINSIEEAKEFLNLSVTERISKNKNYSEKIKLFSLIDSITKLSQAAMENSLKNKSFTKGWVTRTVELRNCRKLLEENTNTKLVFLRLCINL